MAIRKDPKNAQVHYNLGNALKDLGRPEDAVDSYRHALEFDPKSAETHYNLGVMNQKLGHLDAAAESYQHAFQINPQDAEIHNSLGAIFLHFGEIAEAKRHFRQTIDIDPGFAEAYNNLGNALNNQGNAADAVDIVRSAIRPKPTMLNSTAIYSAPLTIFQTRIRRWFSLNIVAGPSNMPVNLSRNKNLTRMMPISNAASESVTYPPTFIDIPLQILSSLCSPRPLQQS